MYNSNVKKFQAITGEGVTARSEEDTESTTSDFEIEIVKAKKSFFTKTIKKDKKKKSKRH